MRIVCIILFLTLFAVALCGAQTKLSAEKVKAIEVSTPATLPQEPIVPKERTDAEDKGLKGKIKSIIGESQDFSEAGSTEARQYSYVEEYNEKGNFVRRVSFDYKGNPFQITVYGYLNGARVSKYKMITYEYDPPAMAVPPGAVKTDQKPRDTRISYSYGYKYLERNLAEMQMYYNNGATGMRYTYTRNGNTRENLAFDDKGNLNQKYIFKLDKNGNEIEEIKVDVSSSLFNGNRKYLTKYDAFDEKGNWTKRTVSKIAIVNGKEVPQPSYMQFRTLIYYK